MRQDSLGVTARAQADSVERRVTRVLALGVVTPASGRGAGRVLRASASEQREEERGEELHFCVDFPFGQVSKTV